VNALVAVALGLLGVGYVLWPELRRREAPGLAEEPLMRYAEEDAEREAATLRQWSVAAGELADSEEEDTAGKA
jgi:hypothetical protein